MLQRTTAGTPKIRSVLVLEAFYGLQEAYGTVSPRIWLGVQLGLGFGAWVFYVFVEGLRGSSQLLKHDLEE